MLARRRLGVFEVSIRATPCESAQAPIHAHRRSAAFLRQHAVWPLSVRAVGCGAPLPGVAVAAITRRQRGFVVHHVEGGGNPTLNGAPIGADPLALKNGDLVELAGTQMQFVQT